jgi:(p)ppGpp synthase/HD superfamily hydrolase
MARRNRIATGEQRSYKPEVDSPAYSQRLDEALALAAHAFRGRIRKGSGVPYLTHLLQVMVFVAEHGGDEDQMIAALLHDYLEDIPGASAADLEARFGVRVATMVVALSDSTDGVRAPWEERKRLFIASIRSKEPDVRLVCAADKLHNTQSILRDAERLGDGVFARFTASAEQTAWYYESVLEALADGWDHRILESLREAVQAVRALVPVER